MNGDAPRKRKKIGILREKIVRKMIGNWLFEEMDQKTAELNQDMSAIKDQLNKWPLGGINHRVHELRKELNNFENAFGVVRLYFTRPSEDDKTVNFGDEMSVDIIEGLFHKKVVKSDVDHADMFAIGSIMEHYEMMCDKTFTRPQKLKIWGTGIRLENSNIEKQYLEFCAVRGKNTAEKLGLPNTIPMGDPGLLANLVFEKSSPTDKIGIVPHHKHINLSIIERLRSDKRFLVIDPCRQPRDVISDMTSCQIILSSSLHGLIVADSFSIPNARAKFDGLEEGDFKFKDYYSITGINEKQIDIDRIFDDKYLESIKQQYKPIKNLSQIQDSLIKAFPFR